MQNIQPQRSKYKKCTKYYVQDNLLDIIDIEETLSKNRYITKVQRSDFIYSKYLNKYESSNQLTQINPLTLKQLAKDILSPKNEPQTTSNNKANIIKKNKEQNNILLNPDNINYELLNNNQFNINFKQLKLEYKNGYRVNFTKEYYPIEILGAGAFGLVVHVIQIRTGQKMAVKIIDKKNIHGNSHADYLYNEVRILHSLDNPRIMKIYDLLDNDHYFFIFMELIEGGNLKNLIIQRYLDNNTYLFRDNECSIIMKGIFEALNYLHKKNIIHRDIKPENIVFKNKDDLSSVILCDFGLAYQLTEYEKSISGTCGTMIYMAPEILLKKNYDYLVDSFSAGIILYILCSGGMHPFYTKGISQKDYIEKIVKQKCLCTFSKEMPLLARNLFLKLCKFESVFRYETFKALNHPWITRSAKSPIPLTILEEYKKSDKIKTFNALLSSVISLVILKKTFKMKVKKENLPRNYSYYEIIERNSSSQLPQIFNMNNIQDKHMILKRMKRNINSMHENIEETCVSPKKIVSSNSSIFNLKTTKNKSKLMDSPFVSKLNYFERTKMSFYKIVNNNNNNSNNIEEKKSLMTHSYREGSEKRKKEQKKQKKKSKSKSSSKCRNMKSASSRILLNNIKKKKIKDNSAIQYASCLRKKNTNNKMDLNGNKYNNMLNNKIILKKHIVIESKIKSMINESIKNNNSTINSSNTKNKIDTNNSKNIINYYGILNNINKINFGNKINLKIKEKNHNIKDYNQNSHYRNFFNGSNNQSKKIFLRKFLSNHDF